MAQDAQRAARFEKVMQLLSGRACAWELGDTSDIWYCELPWHRMGRKSWIRRWAPIDRML